MIETPNYRFYKKPRFSVNHLTRYMSTTKASQREAVIREAKFPKKMPVSIYGQAKRIIQDFFPNGNGDTSFFDETLGILAAKARREENSSDEALRCIKAIQSFKELYASKRWNKFKFEPMQDIKLKINQVTVNIRLDALITETGNDGSLNSGGLSLFLAKTPESRKNIENRRRQVSSLILWGLGEQGNIEVLPRLCMSMDVFGRQLVKASDSQSQFRINAESSCREATASWDSVEPPKGYDGPQWK